MEQVSFISLGGIGDVTKNMYVYEYKDEILLVDCGMGFADETSTPGVDFLIPDITYLKNALKNGRKIVGMVLSHGHEDHIGALPFILPQLPKFPVFGSTLTAALANEKLAEIGERRSIEVISFTEDRKLGSFNVSLIRMTHSIIDAGNIFIQTPVGNFYHGSDFKFDFTPVDGRPSDLQRIVAKSQNGVLALMSDCLGSERAGHSPSEMKIYDSFDEAFRKAQGKIFLTTYSSNISRLNQAIEVAITLGKRVCFMGRSVLKARDIGRSLNYMKIPRNMEIRPHDVKKYKSNQVLVLVAGSQAQQGSALMRIASGDDRDLFIAKGDTVIFSSDPIPGNEVNINSLVDTLSKKGAKVVYSQITDEFHVSGHGSENDLKLLISLTKPQFMVPIGGTYRQMSAYRAIAKSMGYEENKVFLIDSGQEVLFTQNAARIGRKVESNKIYVDEITGEAVEHFVVRDRVKMAKEGVVIVMAEIDMNTGQLASTPDILARGIVLTNREEFAKKAQQTLSKIFSAKRENVPSIGYFKKTIQDRVEELLYRDGRREPFVIPVVIEV